MGGHRAHELLHTEYQSRKRIVDEDVSLFGGSKSPVSVTVCVGTSCFLRGSQELLKNLLAYVERRQLAGQVNIKATFCHERCDRGPTVGINDAFIEKCTLEKAVAAVEAALKGAPPVAAAAGHSCSGCGGCKA